MRSLRFKVLLLILVAGAAAASLAVKADTFGTACCGKADNKDHFACWVPDPGASTIPWAIWQYLFGYMNEEAYEASDVFVWWDSTCAAGTDMFLDNRLANDSFLGLEFCRVSVVNGICTEAAVQINDDEIVEQAAAFSLWVEDVRQHNWCHEGGHSLGLNHVSDSSSCLQTGVQTITPYSAHHLDHMDTDL
jgi:hypothetical protein